MQEGIEAGCVCISGGDGGGVGGRAVELMCQMSEESVRAVAASRVAGCQDAYHAVFRCVSPQSHKRPTCIWVSSDRRMMI